MKEQLEAQLKEARDEAEVRHLTATAVLLPVQSSEQGQQQRQQKQQKHVLTALITADQLGAAQHSQLEQSTARLKC